MFPKDWKRDTLEAKIGKSLAKLPFPIVLTIDEAQKEPAVFELVKIIHDNFKEKVKIILSGSASLTIQKRAAESLAGRISYVYLYPLSIREILTDRFVLGKTEGLLTKMVSAEINLPLLRQLQAGIKGDFNRERELELLWRTLVLNGNLPAVWQQPQNKELIFKSLVETYLDKDIRRLGEVGHLEDFTNLVSVLAFEVGQLANIASLSRDLAIAVNTVKKYLSVLKNSFILNKLPPFFGRPRRRIVKSAKLYFFDVGLVNFLTKRQYWENVQGETAGFLLENIILKSFEAANENKPVPAKASFWRDYQGHEIDLVIENGQGKIPVEITTAEVLNKEKLRNFNYFFEEFKESSFGLLVYRGKLAEVKIGSNKVFLLPWWLWW